MQGVITRVLLGSVMLGAVVCQVQAEALQPDPAWQEGRLANGFQWQILQTPQRPNDRIQIRLLVNTGSLSEKSNEIGFSSLVSKLGVLENTGLSPVKRDNLWKNALDPDFPLPPMIVSYDFTVYNLSLPNNQPELLKDAFALLAGIAKPAEYTEDAVRNAVQSQLPVVTFPANIEDPVWRARLEGSNLKGHNPGKSVNQSVNTKELSDYQQRWYTPDVMTLYVAGNVDNRVLTESINQAFSPLNGKRVSPVPVPVLADMKPETLYVQEPMRKNDQISLIWDLNWSPVKDSDTLNKYWLSDLAREVIFVHLGRSLEQRKEKDNTLVNIDCRVQYQRASCSLNVDTITTNVPVITSWVGEELGKLRNQGISDELYQELQQEKQLQLTQLFARYAKTSTALLINQRLLSQQSNIIDIPPEQYQRLRQAFLANLSKETLNQELAKVLSEDITFVLTQSGETPTVNLGELRIQFEKQVHPESTNTANTVIEPASAAVTAEAVKPTAPAKK
ncbi:insulinase family protein [Proteus hauseri]|uniref:insulinase family protein n=1 Tax=Proteus hauseri TaxID=183417 RepID=UPI0032DBE3C7